VEREGRVDRGRCKPLAQIDRRYAMGGGRVMAADSDDEAGRLATPSRCWRAPAPARRPAQRKSRLGIRRAEGSHHRVSASSSFALSTHQRHQLPPFRPEAISLVDPVTGAQSALDPIDPTSITIAAGSVAIPDLLRSAVGRGS